MKLSQLQKILDEYQEEYGDIDIKLYDCEFDDYRDFTENSITVTNHNPQDFIGYEYITIWC